MNIKPFAVEEWMNEYEVGALYNIAETCVDSVSLDELFELTGENKEDFLKDFCAQRLTYGDIWGSEALRSGIAYGAQIRFDFRPDAIHLFDPQTEQNLR